MAAGDRPSNQSANTTGGSNQHTPKPTNHSSKPGSPQKSRFPDLFADDIDRIAIWEDHTPFRAELVDGSAEDITRKDIAVYKDVMGVWNSDGDPFTISPTQAKASLRKSRLRPMELNEITNMATSLKSPVVDCDPSEMDIVEFFVALKLVQKRSGLDHQQLKERLSKVSSRDRDVEQERLKREKAKEEKEKAEKEKAEREKAEREKAEREKAEREKVEKEKAEKEKAKKEKAEKEKAEKEKAEKEKAEKEKAEKEKAEREKAAKAAADKAAAERAAAEAAQRSQVQYVPYNPPVNVRPVQYYRCCGDVYVSVYGNCNCGKNRRPPPLTHLGEIDPFRRY
jgi:chemotaxis protein histidine kinase CheA